MDNDEYSTEYFCRLCASEGVVIHPLFPPGDEDPKDELIRMIDVLTSVTLTRTQDSGAVICDKCLQMLDLFCQFREECLRQDVMIRTRRELEKEQRQLLARQLQQQQMMEPTVQIKEEEEQIVEPPTIVIDDCKDEERDEPDLSVPVGDDDEEEEDDDDDEDDDEPQIVGPMEGMLDSSLVANCSSSSNSNSNSFLQSPAEISLYSQASNLSISVQVNQISLSGMSNEPTECLNNLERKKNRKSRSLGSVRKGKLDPNKPPPDCDQCQESFGTHYDYEQHMDQVHAWDRGTRCSLACDPCQMRFTKSYNLKRHMYEVHGELAPGLTVTACDYCGLKFLRGYTLNRHIAKVHSKRRSKKMLLLKSK
ncbi:zinc finger protein 148-like [Uranotaenia lowii]|uniref:zinc finger protein 148-like n=1 Tax=Uranotaenia lowii TaxID=190385 RepID=UPI002478B3C3|nr:zinc finger protein 148-like [Uranotaenia lowii]